LLESIDDIIGFYTED